MGKFDNFILTNCVSRFIIDNYLFSQLSLITGFFVVILLTGCSVDNPSQNDYTDNQYDASTNLTLLPSTEMWIDFNIIVKLHKDMQECLGLAVNPETDETIISFRSFEKSTEWHPYKIKLGSSWGYHHVINGVSNVYINTDLDKAPHIYQGFDRDEYTDTQTVKHEFIHSITYHNNGVSGHGEEFTRCDAWVNTYN